MKLKEKIRLIYEVLFYSKRMEVAARLKESEILSLKSEIESVKDNCNKFVKKCFDEKEEQQYIIHDKRQPYRVELFHADLDMSNFMNCGIKPTDEVDAKLEVLTSHKLQYIVPDVGEMQYMACHKIAKEIYDKGWVSFETQTIGYNHRLVATLNFYK